jgi:hypothetical protein
MIGGFYMLQTKNPVILLQIVNNFSIEAEK